MVKIKTWIAITWVLKIKYKFLIISSIPSNQTVLLWINALKEIKAKINWYLLYIYIVVFKIVKWSLEKIIYTFFIIWHAEHEKKNSNIFKAFGKHAGARWINYHKISKKDCDSHKKKKLSKFKEWSYYFRIWIKNNLSWT